MMVMYRFEACSAWPRTFSSRRSAQFLVGIRRLYRASSKSGIRAIVFRKPCRLP
jgi:hypothetical protein